MNTINTSTGTTNVTKRAQTFFLVSSNVGPVLWEDIFGIPFKPIGFNISSVPDEVLEEFVAVLVLHDDTSGLDDISNVLDEFLTFGTKPVLVDRGMIEDIIQRVVDLSVVG